MIKKLSVLNIILTISITSAASDAMVLTASQAAAWAAYEIMRTICTNPMTSESEKDLAKEAYAKILENNNKNQPIQSVIPALKAFLDSPEARAERMRLATRPPIQTTPYDHEVAQSILEADDIMDKLGQLHPMLTTNPAPEVTPTPPPATSERDLSLAETERPRTLEERFRLLGKKRDDEAREAAQAPTPAEGKTTTDERFKRYFETINRTQA